MRKTELDHLLETAVAKALGVKLPRRMNAAHRPMRKSAQGHRHIKHAA
jgi:hypothetical protein